ncbi:hypothetical protein DVH05_028549 [Phytophthora capsici]|nr:hypothetical protein DVH05_028549 [Phytophthora capsici]
MLSLFLDWSAIWTFEAAILGTKPPLSAQGLFPEAYEDAVDSYTRALEKQSQDADTLPKRAAAYMKLHKIFPDQLLYRVTIMLQLLHPFRRNLLFAMIGTNRTPM